MTTHRPSVVVLDYGSGNTHSASRALEHAGAAVTVTADRSTCEGADGLVIPGVGAFAAVMQQLTAVRGPEIIDRRLAGGRHVLGICVGMQIMFDSGDERGAHTDGLGQWPGIVTRLNAPQLPHLGWNTLDTPAGSTLFDGVENERFYFVHSFAAHQWNLETNGRTTAPLVTWATHGHPFVAAVENGPLTATQFHPEKSGSAGLRLLANWVDTLR
ncbi:MAG TPA: imidazole glycerol phosphate synthase subunit HisH [Terrimesophilobacter sp.]|nr:imidazole glycerol phosphate synthase subunit HisH [Terrimesophilobacter sp.]